jgi:hypothetical protein
MKTKLGVKKLGVIVVVLMSTFIFSCKDGGLLIVPDPDLTLKNGDVEVKDNVCELTAGQYIDAGHIVYSKVGENLVVTYVAGNGWMLTEVHLYVGTVEGLPRNKTAIQIGHFPYSNENLGGVETWAFTVPLAGLDPVNCIIAAHAIVYNASLSKEETAWANCTFSPAIIVKTKFAPEPTGFAVTKGESYIDYFRGGTETGHWCDRLGYNFYDDGDEYSLYSGNFPDAGKVNVSDDGEFLTIEIKSNYDLIGSYVFVGSLNEFGDIVLRESDDCPNFYLFPYIDETTVGKVHIYDIPLNDIGMINNISFESAFGSKRWGWYSTFTW